MVGVAILGIATIAMLLTLGRAAETAQFSSDRNESLDQLRVMSANFAKDVRQGVRASYAGPSAMTFDTYVGGTLTSVTWRVVTTGGQERFERQIGAAASVVYVVDLTTPNVFSYYQADTDVAVADPSEVTRVRLTLATQPDPRHPALEVATDVEMRNVP
jgi:hypothetical protein